MDKVLMLSKKHDVSPLLATYLITKIISLNAFNFQKFERLQLGFHQMISKRRYIESSKWTNVINNLSRFKQIYGSPFKILGPYYCL